MNQTIITYIIYLVIAIPITIWVGRTLHRNGRVFLLSCFHGNEELADSINRLLLVGFYLVNLGFVVLYLKIDKTVTDATGTFEVLSTKIGIVLLILGAMHFLNMLIFTKLREKPETPRHNTPPALPQKNEHPAWRDELKK